MASLGFINITIVKNKNITIKRKNYKGKLSETAIGKEAIFIDTKDA